MFYIKVDNEETGPITAKQLKHKAKSGKINKSVLVRKENSDKWYPSNKVKGLFPDNSSQDLSDFIFLGITSEEVFDVNNPVICTDVRQKSKEIKKPKEKDQLIAVLLSFVIPGMGQIYKGEIIQGITWLILIICNYIWFPIFGSVLHMCCICQIGFDIHIKK